MSSKNFKKIRRNSEEEKNIIFSISSLKSSKKNLS